MRPPGGLKVIRDPLWNNIEVEAEAVAVLDAAPFQRLRYIRQLGHAFLVYPAANHTRFEHAVGTYHLARRVLSLLEDHGELGAVAPEEQLVVRLAGLVHDIGHYPFSHALEEAGLPSHEDLAQRHLRHPELRAALDATGIRHLADRLGALIDCSSESPLQGLISGSLDLDKLEYLSRDARMCGVPYGTVDVDRLLQALTIVPTAAGTHVVGVREKGVSALESLLFARYQMYRNVYWHHAVRSATAMFKRAVRNAMARGQLTVDAVADSADEDLMHRLRNLDDDTLARRLHRRHLFKRMVDVAGEDVPADAGDWVAEHPDLVERVENALARELSLQPGELLLDFPTKAKMLDVDMPLLKKDGTVLSLGSSPGTEQVGIQRVADELHARARRLRIFTAEHRAITPASVIALVERTKDDVERDLGGDQPLLS